MEGENIRIEVHIIGRVQSLKKDIDYGDNN